MLKEEIRDIWEWFQSNEKRHADNGFSSWHKTEIDFAKEKLEWILLTVKETEYSKEWLDKLEEDVDKLYKDPEEWFLMNEIQDHIHNLFEVGMPEDDNEKKMMDEYTEMINDTKGKIDGDSFYHSLDDFPIKLYPPRGSSNVKQERDISMKRRYMFWDAVITKKLGEDYARRFGTYVHDWNEQILGGRIALEFIPDITNAFKFGLISDKWYTSLILKIHNHAMNELGRGPNTWGKDDYWRVIYEQCFLIKHCLLKDKELIRDCQTINCSNETKVTKKEIKGLQDGKDIRLWWCKEHKKKEKYVDP